MIEDDKKLKMESEILQSLPVLFHNGSSPNGFCLDGALQYAIYERVLLRSSIRNLTSVIILSLFVIQIKFQ
jgi:hypothetical protein